MPWKGTKAKPRIVAHGDKDPHLTSLRRDAPTLTRLGFYCIMQICDPFFWKLIGGDITGAFLQGDQSKASRSEPIFLEQSIEGLPGLVKGQLLKVKNLKFGLALETWTFIMKTVAGQVIFQLQVPVVQNLHFLIRIGEFKMEEVTD